MKVGRFMLLSLLGLILAAVILGSVLVVVRNGGVSILDKPLHVLTEGWTADYGSGPVPIEVGDSYADSGHERVVYRVNLPLEMIDPQSLIFRNPFQYVNIRIDGKDIFTFGHAQSSMLSIPSGGYHLVAVPPGNQGKILEITFESMFAGQLGRLPLVTVGQGFTLLVHVLLSSIVQVFLSSVSLMFGLILTAMGLYSSCKKMPTKGIVYLGIFVFLAGLITWLSSDVPQLVFGHQQLFMFIKISILVLCPIPFLQFIKRFSKPRTTMLFNLAMGVIMINYLGQVGFLLLYGKVSSGNFIPIHLTICLSIILVLHTLFTDKSRSTASHPSIIILGFCFLCVGIFIDLIRYYLEIGVDNTRFFQIGLLIFTIITSVDAANRVIATYQQSVRAQLLEHLAYTDILTGLPNRTAFERDMDNLVKGPRDCRYCMVVMLDLDHLKDINDTFGHRAGDLALQCCARAIKEIFEQGGGSPYRIGGDEFVVLLPEASKKMIETLENRLVARMKEESSILPYQLVISCGYADGSDFENPSLQTLQEKADEMMYRIKYRARPRKQMDTPLEE